MPRAPHRILLVPAGRRTAPAADEPKVRRYRLARLRLAESRQPVERRFEHLARAYD